MAEPSVAVNAGDDFEAAKGVVEKLDGLTRERQERVLRWVTETLGIANPVAPKPASTSPPASADAATAPRTYARRPAVPY